MWGAETLTGSTYQLHDSALPSEATAAAGTEGEICMGGRRSNIQLPAVRVRGVEGGVKGKLGGGLLLFGAMVNVPFPSVPSNSPILPVFPSWNISSSPLSV